MRKVIVSGLLASVLLVPAALAQQTNRPAANAPAPAASNQTVTAPAGQWRASKLVGLNVYNGQNEKLGDISEVLMDQSGRVSGVIIGVGGFLGMGQHDILVGMDKLKFVDEPIRSSANTPANAPANGANSTNAPARPSTTGAAPAPASATTERKWYPDHAMLNATKDQLKAMPQFKY